MRHSRYVKFAVSLGYQQGQTKLSANQWAAILRENAAELADPASRSRVFAEIARYHDAIVSGLETNRASTVWQRLHDEQGLQVSLRSSQMRRSRARRYLCLFMRLRRHRYLPNQARRMQPTVLRDDPLPGQEAQGDYG